MKRTVKLASALFAIGATLGSLGFITPARAESTVAASARVRTADLDLSTQEGRQRLALRIGRTARTLCEDSSARLDIRARQASASCRATIVRSARPADENREAARRTEAGGNS